MRSGDFDACAVSRSSCRAVPTRSAAHVVVHLCVRRGCPSRFERGALITVRCPGAAIRVSFALLLGLVPAVRPRFPLLYKVQTHLSRVLRSCAPCTRELLVER